MADGKPTDPAAVFQDWVTQWERAADKFSNQFMGTDEFSKSMNQMQNFQLEFQRGFGELMAKQLANFNLPSREDILQLSEDVRDIDRQKYQQRNSCVLQADEPTDQRVVR